MELTPSETLLFALLKISLHGQMTDRTPFEGATVSDWKKCRSIADRQGVIALAYDGLVTLPDELRPSKEVRIPWALATEACETQFHRFCDIASRLSEFYACHGISTVQLKGTALASYYHVPSHRQGGDIDIYTFSSDPSKMSHAEANKLAEELMRKNGIKIDDYIEKHSSFQYDGATVENHRTFLDIQRGRLAVDTDKLLYDILNPREIVPDGKHRILAPSAAFNTIFIPFHAAQHYGSGLYLHQVYDWACLLVKYGLHIPDGVSDKLFLRFLNALTLICNTWLGTSIRIDYDIEMEKEADRMLREILRPPFSNVVPVKGKTAVVLYKTRRKIHRIRISRRVFRTSPIVMLARTISLLIRHPEIILKNI